jgi:hypothetical protein
MEVNDPPNRIRYREIVCTSVAGQIEFLTSCPTTCLQKPYFRIADKPCSETIARLSSRTVPIACVSEDGTLRFRRVSLDSPA